MFNKVRFARRSFLSSKKDHICLRKNLRTLMRTRSETWTMVPMIFDLTICRTRILALVTMLATLSVLTIAPAVAHADGIPDVLLHTFGFGTSGGPSCNNVDGTAPKGSLTFANSLLFGRTSTTQASGGGIIFHIDPAVASPDTT